MALRPARIVRRADLDYALGALPAPLHGFLRLPADAISEVITHEDRQRVGFALEVFHHFVVTLTVEEPVPLIAKVVGPARTINAVYARLVVLDRAAVPRAAPVPIHRD